MYGPGQVRAGQKKAMLLDELSGFFYIYSLYPTSQMCLWQKLELCWQLNTAQ
jgi:hypothetical protein